LRKHSIIPLFKKVEQNTQLFHFQKVAQTLNYSTFKRLRKHSIIPLSKGCANTQLFDFQKSGAKHHQIIPLFKRLRQNL